MKLIIGTRGSQLALWQANHVAQLAQSAASDIETELRIIKTKGDRIQDVPLAKVGGKGLFVKEIEQQLIDGGIDLAVHSLKDVPADLIAGGTLCAILPREDPRDALVSSAGSLDELPEGACVGTSSLRRRTQLLSLRSDLQVKDLRGNVDTRLRKLREGQFDAIILAVAGLQRLGLADQITERFDPDRWLPAAGQGALGIETRAGDDRVNEIISRLHHEPTAVRVAAERALLAELGGGCQVPIAAHAVLRDKSELCLRALVGHPSGKPVYQAERSGSIEDATEIGKAVGQQLLQLGGDAILEEVL